MLKLVTRIRNNTFVIVISPKVGPTIFFGILPLGVIGKKSCDRKNYNLEHLFERFIGIASYDENCNGHFLRLIYKMTS